VTRVGVPGLISMVYTHDQPRRVRASGRRPPIAAALGLLAIVAVAGCGGSGSASCAAGAGDGTLMIVVSGGHDPMTVSIEGAGMVTGSATVTASAGPHAITAAPAAVPQAGITSQVYAATIDHPDACVRAGETTVVNVTYALVPTSGKLWAGVSNAPLGATMLGFAPASVSATRSARADVVTDTGGSDGFTFDRDGNMWVLGGTTADPPVARYPAAMFGNNDDKRPDVTIESPSFGAAIPGPKVLAFDAAGNLWVSVVAGDKVVMFTAAEAVAGGSPTAAVERTGITSPQGLAFDSAGNLWVAAHDDDAVVRIDANHLTSSGSGSDLAITAKTPSPDVNTLTPISLAFDAAGNLWVNYDGTIARISPSEQVGTGPKTITPGVQITTDVSTLPVGIAFDQDGGLWVAHAVNKFARYDPTQLTASSAATPSIIISSADVGSASWFAMYPAPAFTPLYHKVP
jgi:sugar lactone lactonase YvrE